MQFWRSDEEMIWYDLECDCDHAVISNFRGDGDVAREVEVHGERNKFVQRHEVVRCHQRYMKDQDESVVVWINV